MEVLLSSIDEKYSIMILENIFSFFIDHKEKIYTFHTIFFSEFFFSPLRFLFIQFIHMVFICFIVVKFRVFGET